jgi:murein DD-endopeptidase MepM/ murein hydrolase activator NlpD
LAALSGAVPLIFQVFAAQAEPLELKGRLTQGGLVWGNVAPGSGVRFLDRDVRVGPDGLFVIGFGRDFKAKAEVEVTAPGGAPHAHVLAIAKRRYKIERIDGLAKKMVSPGPKALARIRRENKLISRARRRDTPEPYFARGFAWPAIGPISGVYGSQRILNGQPRRPHFGVDVAMPVGTPVRAAAAGAVVLAELDLYFTGVTVMIDHGHGVTSIYLHMHSLNVKVGDSVAQGDVIGAIGQTGRATGPHLDWRINWFEQRIDPQLLTPPMPRY